MKFRDRIKDFRRVPAKNLLPNPKNPRLHPKEQADALRALLSKIGYADAVLVRELSDGKLMLIDGHLRAQTTPEMEVPVLITDLSEEEADLVLATLDPLATMAKIDSERLKALLESIQTDDPALEELFRRTAGDELWELLHPEEIKAVEISCDRADELALKWGTKNGQVWRVGPHLITCGDSRDAAVVARIWTPDSPRLRMIWTDPPYGVSYASKNRYLNESDRGNRVQKPITNDDPKLHRYLQLRFE